MSTEKPINDERDTSPFIRSARINRLVHIQEINKPPSVLFDTNLDYPSDKLPEWFQGLQSIVEDETFSDMVINLRGGRVSYHISIVVEQG